MQVEHAIPIWSYDHSCPAETRKCHSKANTRLMTAKKNQKRYNKIIERLCLQVGTSVWPAAWGGLSLATRFESARITETTLTMRGMRCTNLR
jgi:hypothetical protein